MDRTYLILFILNFSVFANASPTKCLQAEDFTKKVERTEELIGEWKMAHVKSVYTEGIYCPSPKLKVTPVYNTDIAYWKEKCLHKLDISILDETKFELKVTFPDDYDVRFTIIHRETHGDQILFPSCVFGKLEFVRNGDYKMWIATREDDGKRLPVAVSVPESDRYSCITLDDIPYVYC